MTAHQRFVFSLLILLVLLFVFIPQLRGLKGYEDVRPNIQLKDGVVKHARGRNYESPFILDYVFTKDEKNELYLGDFQRISGEAEQTLRILGPIGTQITFVAGNPSEITTPKIWLYNSVGHMIADGDVRKNGTYTEWVFDLPKTDLYRIKIQYSLESLQKMTMQVKLGSEKPDQNVMLKEYFAKSLKRFELTMDFAQLDTYRQMQRDQEDSWSKGVTGDNEWPIVSEPKGKVVARLRSPESQWAISAMGISGLTSIHRPAPQRLGSVDFKVTSGELPYGLRRFKLYTLLSKGYLTSMIFESLLRDSGLFMPRQDLVQVSLNSQNQGYFELFEDISDHAFEWAQREEGPVLGYDSHALGGTVDSYRYVVKDFSKLKGEADLSAPSFSENICTNNMLNMVSFATLFGGTHGLAQSDLRFHLNPRKFCHDPVLRDYNLGVTAIRANEEWNFSDTLKVLGTLAPRWRPDVLSYNSNFIFVQPDSKSGNIKDPFHWWSVAPATLSFFSQNGILELLDEFHQFWLNSQTKTRILRRIINAEQVLNANSATFSETEKARLKTSLDEARLLIEHSLSQFPPAKEKVPETHLQRAFEQLAGSDFRPSQEDWKQRHWRNSTIISMAEHFLPKGLIKVDEQLGGHSLNSAKNVHLFLYRKGNPTHEALFFIQRHISEDQLRPKDFILRDSVNGETFLMKGFVDIGHAAYTATKSELLLNSFAPGERLRLGYFLIPRNHEYRYLHPVIKDHASYFGVREYAVSGIYSITPKTKDSNHKNQIFNVRGNNLYIKKGAPTVTAPIIINEDENLIIDKPSELRFGPQGCLIVYGRISTMGKGNLFLHGDGTRWAGVHFHSKLDQTVRNWHLRDIGTGSELVQCAGRSYTGALSFFGGRAKIENLQISNNKSEDSLHCLRAEMDLKKLNISGSQSDAFDADFCSVKLSDSIFHSNLGDGFDISGSLGWVKDSVFHNQDDKNISVGENSYVLAEGLKLYGSKYGAAVKDSSYLKLAESVVFDNKSGISLYVKKPYFQPPHLKIESDTHGQSVLFKNNNQNLAFGDGVSEQQDVTVSN